jgi:chromatin segregation and condensation protein Rec8/ScpA/Scc1 (kleisin family)
VLEQRIPGAQIRFQSEQWSVKDKMDFILESVRGGEARTFTDLFALDRVISEFIATFLAVLELVQMGLLKIFQTGPLGEIRIELHLSEEQGDG